MVSKPLLSGYIDNTGANIMKKFKIKVPFSEMVYGTVTYVVIADTKEQAVGSLIRDKGAYHWDTERDYSENYDECWDKAEWEEHTT
jgi:hypothetical protein